jgi:monofunctional chorismate mutase
VVVLESINELREIRKQIDKIDEEILILLNKRMQLCEQVAKVKKKANLQIEDKKREEEILQKVGEFRSVFEEIIKLCKDAQKRIINKNDSPQW